MTFEVSEAIGSGLLNVNKIMDNKKLKRELKELLD